MPAADPMEDPENLDDELVDVPPRRRRKGIYILPNLFTLAALFGGFYAVVMAMNARFEQAAIGIFCAMVLDSLDGRVARMTNTTSAFGEQMDSLSDMVSFGAAPALIVYEWALKGLGKLGWIAAFIYCSGAALRHRPSCASRDQLRDLSTSLLALIQGIIARSFSPTTSIWCSSVRRRRLISVGAPALFSRMKLFAYSPVWMSFKACFIASLVSALTIFGPVTYSPYSALFEIE